MSGASAPSASGTTPSPPSGASSTRACWPSRTRPAPICSCSLRAFHDRRFSISREPLIVFTSNVFAIPGLRAMYFMLAGAVERFHLLKYGLAFILLFVGLKMVWLNGVFDGKFPITWSLGIIGALLAASIAASLWWPKRRDHETVADGPPEMN
ncbi:MAG: hypothetical protein ABL982_08585 [Vicinamibacterales bacterium]